MSHETFFMELFVKKKIIIAIIKLIYCHFSYNLDSFVLVILCIKSDIIQIKSVSIVHTLMIDILTKTMNMFCYVLSGRQSIDFLKKNIMEGIASNRLSCKLLNNPALPFILFLFILCKHKYTLQLDAVHSLN